MAKELEKNYDPADIEQRTYDKWIAKKYFHAEVDRDKKPFTIVMPPPNITGQLHMGHALDNTLQDILIRFNQQRRYWKIKVSGSCLGLEKTVRWPYCRTAQEDRLFL